MKIYEQGHFVALVTNDDRPLRGSTGMAQDFGKPLFGTGSKKVGLGLFMHQPSRCFIPLNFR